MCVVLREPGRSRETGSNRLSVCTSQSSKHLNLEESLNCLPRLKDRWFLNTVYFFISPVFVLHELIQETAKQADTHKVVNVLFFPASQRSL